MRAKYIISELATHPYPYEMGMNDGMFYDSEKNSYYVRFDDFGDGLWSVAFNTGTDRVDDLTNRHDSIRVFSTVIDIIKTWASGAKPKVLMFSASKSTPNRVRLYAKLANRFVKNTPYTVLHNSDAIKDFVLKYSLKYVYERQMDNYGIYVIARKDIVDPLKNVEDQVDEGWKETLATAGLAGAIGLGSTGVMNLKQKMSAPSTTTSSQQVVAKPNIKPVQKLVTPSTQTQATQPQVIVNKKQPIEVNYITDSPLEKLLMDTAKKAGMVGEELAQFMAQCAHESWDFKFMIERGKNYKQYEPVFKRNPSTKKVVNVNPKAAILGNTKPGDGFKYRGRGFIQLTGKYNYKKAGEALNLPLVENPKLLEDPKIAAMVSVWFWNHRVKPNISDFSNTKEVTKKINPALRGLEDRHDNFEDYIVSSNM